MSEKYTNTICVILINYQDEVYDKMISWPNVIAHNYVYLFKLDLSSSIKGFKEDYRYKTQASY